MDGTVMNAQVRIGDSLVEISEADMDAQATVAILRLYVPNVDAAYHNALGAGAVSL